MWVLKWGGGGLNFASMYVTIKIIGNCSNGLKICLLFDLGFFLTSKILLISV